MSTVSYILTITSKGSNARFVVSYRSGKFHKLESKNGRLKEQKQWNGLMSIIPKKEADIENINTQYHERGVRYTLMLKEAPKTLYAKFMDAYFLFYETQSEVKPRINAVEGKALKSIISHLQSICGDDLEALGTWEVILSNWNKIEAYYAKQMELRQINSNIDRIIRQIKDGKGTDQARKKANRHADDLRQSL